MLGHSHHNAFLVTTIGTTYFARWVNCTPSFQTARFDRSLMSNGSAKKCFACFTRVGTWKTKSKSNYPHVAEALHPETVTERCSTGSFPQTCSQTLYRLGCRAWYHMRSYSGAREVEAMRRQEYTNAYRSENQTLWHCRHGKAVGMSEVRMAWIPSFWGGLQCLVEQ